MYQINNNENSGTFPGALKDPMKFLDLHDLLANPQNRLHRIDLIYNIAQHRYYSIEDVLILAYITVIRNTINTTRLITKLIKS